MSWASLAPSSPSSPFSPTAKSIVDINDVKFELINWSNPELHHELLRLFHDICCLEFNESEMEKLSVWEHLVKSQDPKFPYRMSLTIAYCFVPVSNAETGSPSIESENIEVANQPSKQQQQMQQLLILGGVDQEYYPTSNCGLMPYIVVSKEARGLGLASLLVKKGFEALNCIAREKYHQSQGIVELFIEVSQKSDATDDGNEYHSLDAAETRHKIWQKVGFVGLEFSFFHPGYLRNSAHQLTVYRPAPLCSRSPVAARVLHLFIHDLFRGILLQEEMEDQAEEEAEKALIPELKGREFVDVGEWR